MTPTLVPESLDTTPTTTGERIVAIDAVRGLAVLGILVMNVVEFGLPIRAYEDPTAGGGERGADLWTWFAQQALFDGRMRALFSMLFGAGIVLFGERLARRGRGDVAADLLLRRCLWLVPFGILHRFGLQWTGDILYQYGLLGALAVPFRRLRPRAQLLAGVLCLLAFTPIELWHHHQAAALRHDAAAAAALTAQGKEVPTELRLSAQRWQRRIEPHKDGEDQPELEAMRSGYATVFAFRWDYHHSFQSAYLYYYFVWDVFGMMLVGMGLCRLGFFADTAPTRAYVAALAAGAAATAGSFALALAQQRGDFAADDLGLKALRGAAYPFLRGAGGLGWAALVLLLVRAGTLGWLVATLAAVGRMALSNYVLQTVCCTLFFFGYGLGRYGSLSRAELMLVWAAVSGVQIAASLVWLAQFRFGPLEWAWRSLTWWRRQPLARDR